MPHRQSPRGRCLAALAATLLLSTCGLPTPRPIIPPPEPLGGAVGFRRPASVPPEFEGYVLFYRLLDAGASAQPNLQPHELCIDHFLLRRSTDRAPAASGCPPLGRIQPLIADPKARFDSITLRFDPQPHDPTAETSPYTTAILLRRDVPEGQGFADFRNCRSTDRDLTHYAGTPDRGCSGLNIQLYVLSYGETASGAPLWSERAVFLDSITLP